MALEIEKWEVWHTYTTYLESTKIDLLQGARLLVASGIAECAMLRDGRTFWRANGDVASGLTVVEVDPINGQSTFKLAFDEGRKAKLDGFAGEAWGQASYFLASERKVLGNNATLLPPYFRAYLGKCIVRFISEDQAITELNLYPVLIVYESGVLIVEFRMIGPETVTELADFIAGSVNLCNYKFNYIGVNPGLVAFASRAYHLSAYKGNFIDRLRVVRRQSGHDIAVKERTQKLEDEHFSFDLAPLTSPEPIDLKSIALTIFHVAAFILGRPSSGVPFVLWGQPPAPSLGEFWSGRPHVHLVRFREQCETASANEARHGPDFSRILSRVPFVDVAKGRRVLPPDARMFQDYAAYVTRASSLWVWSLSGLSAQETWMDANRGNLIYERQVVVELLEYGYMLHRSLYHRASSFATTSEVVAVRKEILRLRLKMREASHSGEIRDLLESGWHELGLPDLITEIDAGLALRESETRSEEAQRSERVGWALTIVFGLVAVPTLADQIIKPIWKLMSLHQFTDPSWAAVVWNGVALVTVVVCLCTTLLVMSHRTK